MPRRTGRLNTGGRRQGIVILQSAPVQALKILAASVLMAALASVSQSGAQLAPPLAQVEAGAAPEEVLCNEGLVLVIRSADPACVRPSTAERLGLEAVPPPDSRAGAPAADGTQAGPSDPGPAEIKAHVLVPAPDFKPAMQHPETGERLECFFGKCWAVSPSSSTYAGLHGDRCVRHGDCFVVSDVPPPAEREPLVFFTHFKGEPLRTTILVDPDRTGYWATATKAELNELMPRLASALKSEIDEHFVTDPTQYFLTADDAVLLPAALGPGFPNARWQGFGLPMADDSFDATAKKYDYNWQVENGWFTATNELDGGRIHHQRYSPMTSADTGLEFASNVMDAMGFDNWALNFGLISGLGIVRGTTLDQTTDLADHFKTRGPTAEGTAKFIGNPPRPSYYPELNSSRLSDGVQHIRANYDQYQEAILGSMPPTPVPLTVYDEGSGWMLLGLGIDGISVYFEGWSDYPIPKPALSSTHAIERALEFAASDPVLSGPECGLSVPDRSDEDRPRYVYLDQVAGTPFWVVDMGACEVRHDLCRAGEMAGREALLSIKEVRTVVRIQADMAGGRIGDWVDTPEQCKTVWETGTRIRATADRIYSSDMDGFQHMPHHQHIFNRAYEINVDIFVDALDGQTVWFRENEEWDDDSRWRISHFEDKNVWFLEDGDITFASNWPKGYVDETMWLLDEWER